MKEITVTLKEDVSINASGQVVVDGTVSVGVNISDPRIPDKLYNDAVRALTIAEFVREYQAKAKEEEIITLMYELFLVFNGYVWNNTFFSGLLNGDELYEHEKWRALAERAIELKDAR